MFDLIELVYSIIGDNYWLFLFVPTVLGIIVEAMKFMADLVWAVLLSLMEFIKFIVKLPKEMLHRGRKVVDPIDDKNQILNNRENVGFKILVEGE